MNDLREFLKKVRSRHASSSVESSLRDNSDCERRFEQICDQAKTLADELVAKLDGLKMKDRSHRKWKSLVHAVNTAWKQGQIDSMIKRLLALQKILSTDMIAQHMPQQKFNISTRSVLIHRLYSRPQGLIHLISNLN